jgi:hypothetical protein
MMKTYLDQLAHEVYAKGHHQSLIDQAKQPRRLRITGRFDEVPPGEPVVAPLWRQKLAYVIALVLLAAVTVTRVVVAAINAMGGGGGGTNLVR